ncbi:MAG: type III pantothenate kinase [Bacteroidetes bacterium]|nr:type III pantothenate kinase [Bacteroidota bacterium]MDA0888695.1 type III pantothenate kinase [Bacteroidota bacterium]MDA1084530.1 type III pantothenate kinase [Bacteroidota bacterium]
MKKNRHLVLDVGNTHVKYGYFVSDTLQKSGMCTHWTTLQWDTFFKANPIESILVGGDGSETKRLVAKLSNTPKIIFIDSTIKYPFTSDYDNLDTLGVDRRAALAGAVLKFPNTPVLIIDAGSCITYDFMDENAHHIGGAISPGRAMRYHAMHLFTEKLPHLNPPEKIPSIGKSTKTSMEYGVESGIIAEIQSQIDTFINLRSSFTIILTGGDANFLNKKIKNTIFAVADLTLIGLYHLLMFNSLHEK